ncbi:MAG: HD domain-containing protein [Eubacterium sp.]|nr:HD domain-containing protein [Eubacterium sp.]
MAIIYYNVIFLFSLVLSMIYISMWHKHFDVNFAMVFALVPVSALGYCFGAGMDSMEKLIISIKISYIGGCFLQPFILFSILHLCQISVKKWMRVLSFAVSSFLFLMILTIGHGEIYYKDIRIDRSSGQPVLFKEYGIGHSIFYVAICLFLIIGLVAVIYSFFRKKQVPRSVIYMIVIADAICLLSFFLGKNLFNQIDLTPVGYLLSEIMFILISYRISLYNVSDTVIDSYVEEQSLGYISFDFKYRHLGSNSVARQLFPEFEQVAVDAILGYEGDQRTIRDYLDAFKNNPKKNNFLFTLQEGEEEKYYSVDVNYLHSGNHKRGYIITMHDDSANQKYIKLLDNYTETLKEEVEEKTQHIVKMHDNLILSLAMMVESRDNSTGGHIMRTSEGVRILIEAIENEGKLHLDNKFCQDVIKAAPMHDLGKIAVDDAVLKKPGRFTEEEYAKMKEHPAEGARVIHQILQNTDDEAFQVVAENVAHYHHERWDGSGYPEGLAGEDIPLEARIMAIADVYDALVSKRVYKDAYDFEKANSIITEGMGSQFDPKLQEAYEAARPKLEEYYQKVQENR